MDLPVEIISQSGQLDAVVQEIVDSRPIALDTEANSRHRYPEQLCPIPIATRHKVYILDTTLMSDIPCLQNIHSAVSLPHATH